MWLYRSVINIPRTIKMRNVNILNEPKTQSQLISKVIKRQTSFSSHLEKVKYGIYCERFMGRGIE